MVWWIPCVLHQQLVTVEQLLLVATWDCNINHFVRSVTKQMLTSIFYLLQKILQIVLLLAMKDNIILVYTFANLGSLLLCCHYLGLGFGITIVYGISDFFLFVITVIKFVVGYCFHSLTIASGTNLNLFIGWVCSLLHSCAPTVHT